MRTKLEIKSSSFYIFEKLLTGNRTEWFYLYDLYHNPKTNTLRVEIGPNNDTGDKRKWLFRSVRNLTRHVDDEKDRCNVTLPQMIFGLDYYENYKAMHMVIACEAVEYSFATTKLPEQIDL